MILINAISLDDFIQVQATSNLSGEASVTTEVPATQHAEAGQFQCQRSSSSSSSL